MGMGIGIGCFLSLLFFIFYFVTHPFTSLFFPFSFPSKILVPTHPMLIVELSQPCLK